MKRKHHKKSKQSTRKNSSHKYERSDGCRKRCRCDEDAALRAPRLGACCLNGICSIEDERWCLENGGYWKGMGTNCWNVQCPNAALGACQTIQGCFLTDEYNCPGIWMGPYSNCYNNYYPPYRGIPPCFPPSW